MPLALSLPALVIGLVVVILCYRRLEKHVQRLFEDKGQMIGCINPEMAEMVVSAIAGSKVTIRGRDRAVRCRIVGVRTCGYSTISLKLDGPDDVFARKPTLVFQCLPTSFYEKQGAWESWFAGREEPEPVTVRLSLRASIMMLPLFWKPMTLPAPL